MKVLFIISLLFCTTAFTQNTAKVGYDLDIDMNIDNAPILNNRSTLDFEIMANIQDISDIKIEVITTPGMIINPKSQFQKLNSIQANFPYSSTIDFIVNQEGEHKITLKVTGKVNGSRYTDSYEYLYFTTSENTQENKLNWHDTFKEDISILKSSESNSAYLADENDNIEVATADENRNIITNSINFTDFYDKQNRGAGMVTINGSYSMRNRDGTGTYPYSNSLVQLLNGISGAHQAWSYTNSTGQFSFPAITNPGSDGVIVRAYSVRFIVGGKGYGVCKPNVCSDNAAADNTQYSLFYSTISEQVTGLVDGVNNIGTLETPFSLTTSMRAMWIKHDMDDAYKHLQQNSLVTGPFTASWSRNSTDGNYYNLGGNIHFKADVADGTNHTVLHEMGHNVMYNAGTFPTTPTDCPNPHYVNLISGTQCAWTEGWASAFANMVNNDPARCFAPSTVNCISYENDPSFDNCFPDWDCGIEADKVEGHVTGALWDIFDADNDRFDINSLGSDEIYDTMEFSAYPAFLSWWSIWRSLGFPENATNSLFQNSIEFTQSYDIDLYNITHTVNVDPFVNQFFALTIRGRNLGDVSSVNTKIELYKSVIPVFNGFEPAILHFDFGQIDKDELFVPYFYFSEAEVGTYYYRSCFVDNYGLDDNSANNCTDVITVTVFPDIIYANGFE